MQEHMIRSLREDVDNLQHAVQIADDTTDTIKVALEESELRVEELEKQVKSTKSGKGVRYADELTANSSVDGGVVFDTEGGDSVPSPPHSSRSYQLGGRAHHQLGSSSDFDGGPRSRGQSILVSAHSGGDSTTTGSRSRSGTVPNDSAVDRVNSHLDKSGHDGDHSSSRTASAQSDDDDATHHHHHNDSPPPLRDQTPAPGTTTFNKNKNNGGGGSRAERRTALEELLDAEDGVDAVGGDGTESTTNLREDDASSHDVSSSSHNHVSKKSKNKDKKEKKEKKSKRRDKDDLTEEDLRASFTTADTAADSFAGRADRVLISSSSFKKEKSSKSKKRDVDGEGEDGEKREKLKKQKKSKRSKDDDDEEVNDEDFNKWVEGQ
eukprot:TRINITY_DN24075_c0_g1_i2.p1 TRINITY_DN24075_c0_g1~~TRINITY_DN24075_c0_g1_i2.p1  ORF type:complete len:379 (+),score=76.35 TRINITY_DN24075_c0_g1_i2:666-1802(+)